ncbi:glutamine--fructose-6-phosphate transaminase (isomerizing) [Hyphobacterium sp. HN65]|uniref:Glutamine--fructose-6-phosphate aminotransferase [isomerizing] n=1 Tax=Hyphobacterium lacteum TaxID=3116575 RepID=A0ABU7LPP7_9PROT|nr:glutamine--fructose-6-phosphate transaminase (isomerizing) [Hyphobacterium sp. HN65]MEE2525877.1 glutamine--fructose-6-phosphate transaminase (isomerizing) [Hyphobacterium sp. HN65]
MCGIIGLAGRSNCADTLLSGLSRLEYRGYDSAGIAVLGADGIIVTRRAVGKVAGLARQVDPAVTGDTGIAHTRWATHGGATEANAHPHRAGRVCLVHNGIIENESALRQEVLADGRSLKSETDSEVVAHLVDMALARHDDPRKAVESVVRRLTGAFALAIMIDGFPRQIFGARRGAPLLAGYSETEGVLLSDPVAIDLSGHQIVALEDGDTVMVEPGRMTIVDTNGNVCLNRKEVKADYASQQADRGHYRHFMQKEIHEQPEVIGRTLSRYVDVPNGQPVLPVGCNFADMDRLIIVACGTAAFAGRVAEYWFERYAGLPVKVDVASEFRYRKNAFMKGDAALFISQSGETADTLEAMRLCKAAGLKTLALVNVEHSTIAREADIVLPTLAGPEIGVASTKAFICQLVALAAMSVGAGIDRGKLDEANAAQLISELNAAPRHVADTLALQAEIEDIAHNISRGSMVIYIGRNAYFPLALEGALKLKEISYMFAEGYAGGELKHGPIALIDEDVSVIALVPDDEMLEKNRSSIRQVASRGAHVIVVADPGSAPKLSNEAEVLITAPATGTILTLLAQTVVVQLIAYHVALIKGTDVDQPRNLAKSVTVE